MLSKSATLLMGLIYDKPLNAYEITKILNDMNIQWWFYIADSTVYTTLKNLEKRELLLGTVEKVGNMPERTIYSLTAKGKMELKETIRTSIVQFDYDTNIFTISAFRRAGSQLMTETLPSRLPRADTLLLRREFQRLR